MRVLSLTLLILGIASFSKAETCPDEALLSPCVCEEDEDSGEIQVDCGDEEMDLGRLRTSLTRLSGKQDVDLGLSDLKLGAVPSNFFSGIGIKKLDISHCDIDSLTSDNQPPLLGLEDSLEELVITASLNDEDGVIVLDLGHLRKLKELDLSYNVITEVGNNWFKNGPESLEFLLMSNNGIEKLGNQAFANLVNLQQLSLDGNRFGALQRSNLPSPAINLEKLELDNNAFTAIPEDLFSNMPALTGVSLRGNGILRLDQRTWRTIWQQLHYVALEGNPIECDDHMNWIVDISNSPAIYGKCNSPKEKYGEDIGDFIDSRRKD